MPDHGTNRPSGTRAGRPRSDSPCLFRTRGGWLELRRYVALTTLHKDLQQLGHRLLAVSPDVAVSRGRDVVAGPFPQVLTATQTAVAHRWALEPWSKGGFAVYHPGQMTTMMPTIAKPEGRLHFAGEHTSSWMGWMEGALESGERTAREVSS